MTRALRLFFALWPAPQVRTRLEALTDETQRHCGGRRIPGDRLHLTLAFLGDVSPPQADGLVALTSRLACPPGTWPIDRLGYFPRGGIVWAGSQTPPAALDALRGQLWQALGEFGFAPDARVFRPHVTLLRKAREKPVERPCQRPLVWHYDRLDLVHSMLDGQQPRYVTLARSPPAVK